MRSKTFFGVCLVGWEERKINGKDPNVFSPGSPKSFSPKWREN